MALAILGLLKQITPLLQMGKGDPMDKTKRSRSNVINFKFGKGNLKKTSSASTDGLSENLDQMRSEGPSIEISKVILGARLVDNKKAELWHLEGVVLKPQWQLVPVGEFSLIEIPEMTQPRHAVLGFITPPPGFHFPFEMDELWEQFKAILSSLGCDAEGFYGSLSLGGQPVYFEEYESDLDD